MLQLHLGLDSGSFVFQLSLFHVVELLRCDIDGLHAFLAAVILHLSGKGVAFFKGPLTGDNFVW